MATEDTGKDAAPAPATSRWTIAVGVALSLAVIALGVALVFRSPPPPPPGPTVVVAPTPSVVVALKELQRLESFQVAVEKVVDMKEQQARVFGLVQAQDTVLLVAVGDVTLGVDFAELREEDVSVDWDTRTARIQLPPAKVLSTRLDNQRTYVHRRSTDLLARRNEALETEARKAAEQAIEAAGNGPEPLKRAASSAARMVESLVRSLGFRNVTVDVRP